MLIIRKAQFEALGELARARFLQTLLTHLTKAFPDRCDALGDAGLRPAIEAGIAKAETFGLVAEQDVAAFIHFTFETRDDFDQHAEFGWAVEALRDGTLEPTERIDRLYDEWKEHRPEAGR